MARSKIRKFDTDAAYENADLAVQVSPELILVVPALVTLKATLSLVNSAATKATDMMPAVPEQVRIRRLRNAIRR